MKKRYLSVILVVVIVLLVFAISTRKTKEPVLENLRVEKIITSKNYEECNDINRIKYIVVHYFGNRGTAEEVANFFRTSDIETSAHYTVDEGNVVYQCVEDDDIAWHCGGEGAGKYKDKCSNKNSIGIEARQCKLDMDRIDIVEDNDWYFDEEVTNNLVELVRYLMDKYDVPIENVIRHGDVTGKWCPRPWFGDDINAYYGKSGNEMWQEFKDRLK